MAGGNAGAGRPGIAGPAGGVLGLTTERRVIDGQGGTEEEALIRAMLETEVDTPKADEATRRRYYQANLNRFRSPDLFEPMHILFKPAQDDPPAYANACERTESVLAELDCPGRSSSRNWPAPSRTARRPAKAGAGPGRAATPRAPSRRRCCRWRPDSFATIRSARDYEPRARAAARAKMQRSDAAVRAGARAASTLRLKILEERSWLSC